MGTATASQQASCFGVPTMEMENGKPSIGENVAELGLNRKVCRICVVAHFEVL